VTISIRIIYTASEKNIIIIYLFILTANGFLPSGSGTTIRHNTQITSHKTTHHSQTKHSTQNYTNNKGHYTITTTTSTVTTTII
jgi:hypothetical protein